MDTVVNIAGGPRVLQGLNQSVGLQALLSIDLSECENKETPKKEGEKAKPLTFVQKTIQFLESRLPYGVNFFVAAKAAFWEFICGIITGIGAICTGMKKKMVNSCRSYFLRAAVSAFSGYVVSLIGLVSPKHGQKVTKKLSAFLFTLIPLQSRRIAAAVLTLDGNDRTAWSGAKIDKDLVGAVKGQIDTWNTALKLDKENKEKKASEEAKKDEINTKKKPKEKEMQVNEEATLRHFLNNSSLRERSNLFAYANRIQTECNKEEAKKREGSEKTSKTKTS